MQDRLGVGFGLEDGALFLERFAQLAEILDDAAVDDGDALGGVRMGVVLSRPAMRGPAGVPDSGPACERGFAQPLLEVFQLAFGAATIELAAFQCRDARGVIAAIFKPLE